MQWEVHACEASTEASTAPPTLARSWDTPLMLLGTLLLVPLPACWLDAAVPKAEAMPPNRPSAKSDRAPAAASGNSRSVRVTLHAQCGASLGHPRKK